MRFRSKAYWKDRAQTLERENDQWVEKIWHRNNAVSHAERELKEQKQTGWRKQAIMQCLVGLSYNEASDLITSVQGDLGRKHGGEIITYSEQS